MRAGELVAFAAFSALLFAGTWAWHLPMMLWDHIDLVPMYDAWRDGSLHASGFWRVHDGSHLHVAAYLVLLFTTAISGGQPLLDCLASLGLLLVQAWVLLGIARAAACADDPGRWGLLLVLVALSPGHLANLQWGWQVAVFISTLGAVVAIALLTRPTLDMGRNLLAVLAASLGVMGFSTTLAVFPIALALVALHPASATRGLRLARMLPWLAAAAGLLWWLGNGRDASSPGWSLPGPGDFVLYVLNYLGAGVSRLATAIAPAWTVVALATTAWVLCRRRHPDMLPWLALMAFGIGAAALTALGRAAEFGVQHAFVTRYASFSLLFWFGWAGLVLRAGRERVLPWRSCVLPLLWALLVFLVANGVHMAKQARALHVRATDLAAEIRRTYPAVPQATMEAAFDWRAPAASAALDSLHARGYAPFSEDAGDGSGEAGVRAE